MTTRGIPQLYYGTEILMNTGKDGSHGYIRSDFPGGWQGDTISAKNGIGLSLEELEGQTFSRQLLQWRKDKPVIHYGELMHFVPVDGFYVYFRYDQSNTVMVILNKNKESKVLDLSRFQERLSTYKSGIDVITGQKYDITKPISLDGMQGYILELEK